jgi:hypothetical protein
VTFAKDHYILKNLRLVPRLWMHGARPPTSTASPLPSCSKQSLTLKVINFDIIRVKKYIIFLLVANNNHKKNNNNNVSGWQDDNMGCIHNKQRTCSDYAYNMGDGMCICTIWKSGSLWVSFILY